MKSSSVFLIFIALTLWINPLTAAEIIANPKNYRQRFARLKPGDSLRLTAGQYTGGLIIKNRHGSKKQWIRVEGMGQETVFVGRKGANTIDINQSSYIAIRNIKFDGRGLEIDAIKAGKGKGLPCHHILIEGNTIVNHGAHQNIVGINTKTVCWDWIIRGNTIIGAGTGIYLGNSDGHQPFIRGVIEHNFIKDPEGYCMQVKRQLDRPDLKGIPTESNSTLIRYNVFIKNDEPSGHGNRPNLLVGGFPKSGPGSKDRYQIYGNVFYHNPRESLFQGTGDLSIHDNIFIDCPGAGINVRTHKNQKPRSVKIYHNTFFQVQNPYKINHLDPRAPRLTAHNLILSAQKIAVQRDDVAIFGSAVKSLVARASVKFNVMDFQLKRKVRPQRSTALKKWLQNDTDSQLDFLKQTKRALNHCGAIALKFKKKRPIKSEARTDLKGR